MTIRKPLAVWQNILLAIPVGAVGGALAGFMIIAGLSFPTLIQNSSNGALLFAGSVAVVGSIIGLVTFPLAYATVGRTNSVFSIVPAGLAATVLATWIGLVLVSALSRWLGVIGDEDSQFLVIVLISVTATFGACAWAAAKERRKIEGQP